MKNKAFFFFFVSVLFGGSLLFLGSVDMAKAGSCTYPVTQVSWTGKINSGVHARDKTCMDSSILETLQGGATVTIHGEADGWYQVGLSNGTKGFIWNSFITVTSKQGNATHDISDEYKTTETNTTVKKTVVEKKAVPTLYEKDSTLNDRVKGYILLQVESFGEAWYVHPEDGKRFYMKDGDTAYEMMRQFGLGVSNADMDKINKGDSSLISRLKGKIVLQVELHGEAYYIHPKDGSVHYLKNGSEAYRVMRELSLGISNKDLDQVQSKDFNTYIAEKEALKKNLTVPVSQDGSLTLSGSVVGGKVLLDWSNNGVDVSKGFKVVASKSINPVYPGNDFHYLSSPSVSSDTWKGLSGTYHFRVCQYLGGICGVYSNDLQLSITDSSTPVDTSASVTLSGNVIDGVVKLSWATTGDFSQGYKVVISGDANPVYPGNTYHFISDSNKQVDNWYDLTSGTYHFRVCQYLGGKCGVYSNDLALVINNVTDENPVINLSGTAFGNIVDLKWDASGSEFAQGFKVVMSGSENPVYPGDVFHYYSDKLQASDSWYELSSGTYHFRVCQYLSGVCGVYSNDVVITVTGEASASLGSVIPVGVDLNELNLYWLNKINALRAESGLRLLTLDQRWVDTATEWATYMGANNLATHDRSDGKSMHQWIDTKNLPFTERYTADGWSTNYFTENISWGYASAGTTEATKKVLDDALAFYLSEASYNGVHYRTIYHADWNSVGTGLYFIDNGNGSYKVYVAYHYGSLVQ